MTDEFYRLPYRLSRSLRQMLVAPQGLAILSGVMLAGYWFGGDGLMLIAGLALPAVIALASFAAGQATRGRLDGLTGLPMRATAVAELDALLARTSVNGRATACFVVEMDDYDHLRRQQDQGAMDEILQRMADRLQGAMRDSDMVARLDTGRFAVVPASMRTADLEAAIQMAARMQAAVAEPISIDATRVYVTASVGFALPRQLRMATGAGLLEAAEMALADAHAQGSGTIRAYSPTDKKPRIIPGRLTHEVEEAMENGEIQAWFQPQVSTDTGEVSGYEALARWVHPRHGIIAPGEFLPAVAAAGQMHRLSTLILSQSLAALRDWDAEGLHVPTISINLAEDDLRDPGLIEKVRWELDRFELSPKRLCIEILETVLTPADEDISIRNVVKLSEMGVGIDLDDFGTGTASIAAIRRFDVHRIKIDRSFVTKLDVDRGQQDMVAAILSMAERLGLKTLAEGVETLGEHAMLGQLGCDTVQGFGIAPPMPYSDTLDWMRRNTEKIAESHRLGRRVM